MAFKNAMTSAPEDRITVQDGVAIRSRLRKRLSRLLHNPFGRRVSRDVAVQDFAASVLHAEILERYASGAPMAAAEDG